MPGWVGGQTKCSQLVVRLRLIQRVSTRSVNVPNTICSKKPLLLNCGNSTERTPPFLFLCVCQRQDRHGQTEVGTKSATKWCLSPYQQYAPLYSSSAVTPDTRPPFPTGHEKCRSTGGSVRVGFCGRFLATLGTKERKHFVGFDGTNLWKGKKRDPHKNLVTGSGHGLLRLHWNT